MSLVSIFVRHVEEKLCPDFTASMLCLLQRLPRVIAMLPARQPQGRGRSLSGPGSPAEPKSAR